MIKSPFLLVKEFLSPLECENALDAIETDTPNVDHYNVPVKTIFRLPVVQSRVWGRIEEYFSAIEQYYDIEIAAVTAIDVEWYPENCVGERCRCENSKYDGKSWRIFNDYDFTVVVFLTDYNDAVDFDPAFECLGGKLEITNHNFSITPTRGMAVIFPSNQYFINRTQSPTLGNAFRLRFHLVCTTRFTYDKTRYEGDHTVWFRGLT